MPFIAKGTVDSMWTLSHQRDWEITVVLHTAKLERDSLWPQIRLCVTHVSLVSHDDVPDLHKPPSATPNTRTLRTAERSVNLQALLLHRAKRQSCVCVCVSVWVCVFCREAGTTSKRRHTYRKTPCQSPGWSYKNNTAHSQCAAKTCPPRWEQTWECQVTQTRHTTWKHDCATKRNKTTMAMPSHVPKLRGGQATHAHPDADTQLPAPRTKTTPIKVTTFCHLHQSEAEPCTARCTIRKTSRHNLQADQTKTEGRVYAKPCVMHSGVSYHAKAAKYDNRCTHPIKAT
jgi:hypothetical protein